ncbi:LrgB-like protein [Moelleriella libera RCEF 2490]|uniref:LrgB-like protein n=1 Tax=Moelleriella libera RCEF 2490 TaxID=1081109 RepID=A0A168BX56_9HYPO|nr:LrgB-like protein [Moelleriella libera RCEF 2490]
MSQAYSTSKKNRFKRVLWKFCEKNTYLVLCLLGIPAVGIPLEHAIRDSRVLDGLTFLVCWLISVRVQRVLKPKSSTTTHARKRHVLATILNPVLATALLMVGYTRAKWAASHSDSLSDILDRFSSGLQFFPSWVDPADPSNPNLKFGAGDLALSLLECGIMTWGFKLFECRAQLFSRRGLAVCFLGVICAVANVFLSVTLARALGLRPEEALAFAARSATLALAKPAVKALGGNTSLNAALVVANGILGQLFYPCLLAKLSVPAEAQPEHRQGDTENGPDNSVTVATGATIGMNGAALGVSFLHEVRSRAAPYAALSMTIFGVSTVVFTATGLFTSLVKKLALGSGTYDIG